MAVRSRSTGRYDVPDGGTKQCTFECLLHFADLTVFVLQAHAPSYAISSFSVDFHSIMLPCQRSPERHTFPSIQEQPRHGGPNSRRERLAPVSLSYIKISVVQVCGNFSLLLKRAMYHLPGSVATRSLCPYTVHHKNERFVNLI